MEFDFDGSQVIYEKDSKASDGGEDVLALDTFVEVWILSLILKGWVVKIAKRAELFDSVGF